MIVSVCVEATERARERGPEPFSAERLEALAKDWAVILRTQAEAGATECRFKTAFSSDDVAAQVGVQTYLEAEGFRKITFASFIAGEHHQLEFTITWPPHQ